MRRFGFWGLDRKLLIVLAVVVLFMLWLFIFYLGGAFVGSK